MRNFAGIDSTETKFLQNIELLGYNVLDYPLAGNASVAFVSVGKVLMEAPCKRRT